MYQPNNQNKKQFLKKPQRPLRRNLPQRNSQPDKADEQNDKNETSWGSVSTWYNGYFSDDNSFHKRVIFPGIKRIMGKQPGKFLLDLACGQGEFSKEVSADVAKVLGVDISSELIEIAQKSNSAPNINYVVSPADQISILKDESVDIAVCVLALQNIANLDKTAEEVSRVLKQKGKFIIVLNHPSFRIPKKSKWDINYAGLTWWRGINGYMTEHKILIDMTPGKQSKQHTVSFHRPLQNYIKAMGKFGMFASRLEEWISHKQAERGPHFNLSEEMRKEIPLFMCIEFTKID